MQFEQEYLGAGSVHHARFLGNITLYYLARLLDSLHHSTDIRLHPLRVAAGILTPIYAYLGALSRCAIRPTSPGDISSPCMPSWW